MSHVFLINTVMFLVVFTVEATLLLSGAWFLTRRSRMSAASRHAVWFAAFATLLVTPLLSAVSPTRIEMQIPALARLEPEASSVTTVEPVPALSMPATEESIPTAPYGAPAPSPQPSTQSGITQLLVMLLGGWTLGALAIACQAMVASWGVARLRRRSRIGRFLGLDPGNVATRIGLARRWELRISHDSTPPTAMTWGTLRPVVLLPAESAEWPSERLEAVLLHELAHVRRMDSLSQIVGLIVCSVCWFNPLVWLALRAMRAAAEEATDDAVVRSGITPSVYASELLKIASRLGRNGQPHSIIGVPIMKTQTIESRIRSIVDPANRHAGVERSQILKICVGAAAVAVLMASLRPTAASPQSSTTPVVAQPAPATTQAAPALAPVVAVPQRVEPPAAIAAQAVSVRATLAAPGAVSLPRAALAAPGVPSLPRAAVAALAVQPVQPAQPAVARVVLPAPAIQGAKPVHTRASRKGRHTANHRARQYGIRTQVNVSVRPAIALSVNAATRVSPAVAVSIHSLAVRPAVSVTTRVHPQINVRPAVARVSTSTTSSQGVSISSTSTITGSGSVSTGTTARAADTSVSASSIPATQSTASTSVSSAPTAVETAGSISVATGNQTASAGSISRSAGVGTSISTGTVAIAGKSATFSRGPGSGVGIGRGIAVNTASSGVVISRGQGVSLSASAPVVTRVQVTNRVSRPVVRRAVHFTRTLRRHTVKHVVTPRASIHVSN